MAWDSKRGGKIDELATYRQAGADRLTLKVRVITPIMGSGVGKKEGDPVSPIRGSGIRGQLRFWWRAVYGSRLPTLAAMKEQESAIWGKPTARGVVSISINPLHRSPTPLTLKSLPSGTAYGAFPARPTDEDPGTRIVRLEPGDAVHFVLGVRFHSPSEAQRAQVLESLYAWASLGGIGGRTRRGFGAVELVQVEPNEVVLTRLLKVWLTSATWAAPTLSAVPALTTQPTIHLSHDSRTPPEQALNDGLGKLKEFRTGVYAKHGNVSAWPEADAIRRLHGKPVKAKDWAAHVDHFPRAAFGLPIPFTFKGERPESEQILPAVEKDGQWVGSGRWPSRLILRPTRQPDGKYKCIALVLRADPPAHLIAKGVPDKPLDWAMTKPLKDVPGTQQDPLKVGTKRHVDVLHAFLAFFDSQQPQQGQRR